MSASTNQVGDWLKTRFPVDPETLSALGSEPVPGHLKRWWWCIGGTPAYLFLVLVATGILMTFYYVPSPEGAYNSVSRITNEISFGWYIRGLHKWSANLMIIALLLHMMRVFFTGAYRQPREANWIIGCLLLLTVLAFGFSGYSLIYEQLSYWGLTVASNLAAAVPFAGEELARFMRGGEQVGAGMLTRLYVLHIGALPTMLIGLIVFHLALVRTHGVSEFGSPRASDEKTFPFFPDHFLTEVMLALFLMFLLTFLAVVFPAHMGERANPLVTPEHIKPEWYFFWSFRWLKLMSDQAAIATQGLFVASIICWPFVDARIRRRWQGSEASIWFGAGAVLLLLVLTIWEAIYLLP